MIYFYNNTQVGAPTLSTGDNGKESLIDLLTAVLVTGFNLTPVDNLSCENGTVTVKINAGHLFSAGDIIEIVGADQSEYNGVHRIITSYADSFTYTISSNPTSPATGEISAKMAPAGYAKVASAEDKAIFQFPGGRQYYLYIDETTCTELYDWYGGGSAYTTLKIQVLESFTDIEHFGNATNRLYFRKGANSTTQYNKWCIVAADTGVYLFNNWANNGYDPHYFGEFNSFIESDLYNYIAMGHYAYNNSYKWYYITDGTQAYYLQQTSYQADSTGGPIQLLRAHTGAVNSVDGRLINMSGEASASIGSKTNIGFRSLVDNAISLQSIYISEYGALRGKMQGTFNFYNHSSVSDWIIERDIVINGVNKDLLITKGYNGQFCVDLTGPWND